MTMILKGCIVSAPALGRLETTEHGYLIAENGHITGIYPVLPEQYAGAAVEDCGDALIVQSFADLHLHAPQYPMLGMGMDLPLLDWLNAYAFPTEARFADPDYARTVYRQLAQELGRDPTPAEIAKEMGISESKVREIIKIAQEPVSLETPIGEEEDSHLGDFIEDENAPAPAEVASNAMMREQLQEVLHTLTPREEKVIRLRFGLEDGQAHTLEEVGKEFNVTRERIRQIEAKALRKLRHPSRSKKVKDFLD